MTIEEARAAVGQSLGLVGFDGTRPAYSALSQQDQERVTVGTVAYVLRNRASFTSEQIQAAQLQAGKVNFGRLGNYAPGTFLDGVVQFLTAYAETAGSVIVGAADVAGRGVKALGLNLGALVTIAAVAAILYFGAPYVVPKLRKAFSQ